LASQKELLIALDQTLKQTITQARATQWQSKTYQAAVTQLMDQLPENKRYWQYGYAKGHHFKGELDQVINLFLRTDGQGLTEEISQQLKALDEKYKRNYGQTKSSYRENKLFGKNGLYARLGNLILRDVKANGRQLTSEDKTQKFVALDYEALAKQLTAVSQEAMAKVRQTQEPMKAAAKVQLAETTKAALNHALTAREKNTIVRAYQERVKPRQEATKQQVGLAYSAKEKNIVHYYSTQERDAIFRENKAENFDTVSLTREMNQIAPAKTGQPKSATKNMLSWQERRTRRQAYYAKRQGSYDNSLNQLRRYLKQSSQEYLNEQKYEAIEKQAAYREEHQKTF
jgi:hypothetical protein